MPLPDEHSCRLQDPKKYTRFARKKCDQKHKGKCIDVIYGIKDVKAAEQAGYNFSALPWLNQRLYNAGEFAFAGGRVFQAIKPTRGNQPPNVNYWKLVSEIQALRFATKIWSASDARAVCKDRKGTFEPAKPKKKQAEQANTAPQSACSFGEDCQISFIEGEGKDYDLEIIGYSGKIIFNHWYWGNVAFDLEGIKFDKAKMPILEEHCRPTHLAFSKKQEINDAVRLYCQFLTNARSQEIKQDMKEGFPMQASVHIIPLTIEYVKESASVKVNGQILTGPGAVFRQSRIREVSLCTLGADRNTKAAVAAKETEEKVTFNVTETEKEIDIMEFELLTAEQLTEERPDLAAEMMASGVDKGEKETRELFNQFAEKFGDDPAFCLEQFKAGVTIEEAVAAQNEKLKASNEELAKAAKEAKETAATTAKVDPARQEFSDKQTETNGGDGDTTLVGEAKWKDEFSKSEDLQGQFKTEEVYIAFKKHDKASEVHIAGRRE